MRKITVSIAAKSFDITLEDSFADFFEMEITRLFKNKNSIEIKDILGAFIQECHDRFEMQKTEKELIYNIDNKILRKN
ncbi:MAG: hypothetical protein LBG21_03190 [Campylobacteraceae bacterium]|jgi:hypothetical protein|nr:hypothetical protein [Campylobacteraceae bacterium]